ncbi:universal stress protein [Hymenobacter sp. BT507]|uniref:Universal stress protein n=1 Tax=Hymenobacter citatus TaxID=2763506 RepID=A0ABR7MFM6_9BACT|nr:universal stress protein [Hymenobacter citatus]MBC6609874.1 universal stress protein [Hymenobacter citatus]
MRPTLLVLTDFSAGTNRSLQVAASLAQPLDAELVVLHVHRDSLLDPERFTGKLSKESYEVTMRALHSLVCQLPIPAVAEVGQGLLPDVVADAIRRYHPLLLVLSRPAADNVPDELATTTALQLLRTSSIPLLVVPPATAKTTAPQHVLLAADGAAFGLGEHGDALRHVLAALHAPITLVHVTESATQHTAAQAYETIAATGLTRGLPRVSTSHICHASPAEGLLQAVAEQRADLLVVLARPRSVWGELFHRSVTAQLLLHSPVPMLVLPVQNAPAHKHPPKPREIDGLLYTT